MEDKAPPLSIKEAKERAKKLGILAANRWKHRRRMAYVGFATLDDKWKDMPTKNKDDE